MSPAGTVYPSGAEAAPPAENLFAEMMGSPRMMEPEIVRGLTTALDLAAFRECRDGSFEAVDDLPGWYLDINPDGRSAQFHTLEASFPFLETFLVDARLFWAKQDPGQLSSGLWTQPDVHRLDRYFQATAVFHREQCVLVIRLQGQEYVEVRRAFSRAKELALSWEQIARAGQALAAGESSARFVSAAAHDTLLRLKRDGTCVVFTQRDDGGVPGQASKISEIVSEPVSERLLELLRKTLDGKTPPLLFEYSLQTGNERSDLELWMARSGADETLVLIRDISERRVAEREAAETNERIRTHRDDLLLILEQLRIGALLVDSSGYCTMINESARRLCDIPAADIVGRSLGQVALFSPEELAQIDAMRALSPGRRQRVPVRGKGPDQRPLWCEVDVHDDPRDPRTSILLLYDVSEVQTLQTQLDERGRYGDIVGKSDAMRQVYRLIDELAPIDTTVLILGETGTGKELVARALHRRSARSGGPFVTVNCAGLTESLVSTQLFGHRRGAFTGAVQDQIGVFEAAHRGTVFLDEIGDVPRAGRDPPKF